MVTKTKKQRKSKRQRGQTNHGWGARKKRKGSGHRGGFGMAGTGKRADHKKTLINKKYGKGYFGRGGITSKSTIRKKDKTINLKQIVEKYKDKKEINLKGFKILGDGEIKIKMIITAEAFTKSAKEKIEKVGGKIIVPVVKKKEVKKSDKSISSQEKSDKEEMKTDSSQKQNARSTQEKANSE